MVRPDNGICTDAACSMNKEVKGLGVTEYQGVDIKSGKQLFHYKLDVPATNNIGEFMGLVHGWQWIVSTGSPLDLWTDSKTAIAWLRKGKANTGVDDDRVKFLLEHCEKFLRNNPVDMNRIHHWHTRHLGEIPADFGRK